MAKAETETDQIVQCFFFSPYHLAPSSLAMPCTQTRRTTRRTATNPPDAENLLTATSTLISGAAATGASKIVKGKGLALVTKVHCFFFVPSLPLRLTSRMPIVARDWTEYDTHRQRSVRRSGRERNTSSKTINMFTDHLVVLASRIFIASIIPLLSSSSHHHLIASITVVNFHVNIRIFNCRSA